MGQLDISQDRRAVFNQVLADCNPGDEIIYHVGANAIGPHKSAAMSAFDAGLCDLYQRKLAKYRYQYVAKKRRR
jgi:hypothetical protein